MEDCQAEGRTELAELVAQQRNEASAEVGPERVEPLAMAGVFRLAAVGLQCLNQKKSLSSKFIRYRSWYHVRLLFSIFDFVCVCQIHVWNWIFSFFYWGLFYLEKLLHLFVVLLKFNKVRTFWNSMHRERSMIEVSGF